MIQSLTSSNHAKILIFSADVFKPNSLTASLSIIRLTINLLIRTSRTVPSPPQLAHVLNITKPVLNPARTQTAFLALLDTHLVMAPTTTVFQFHLLAGVSKLPRISIVGLTLRSGQRSRAADPAAYGCGPFDSLGQNKAHDSTNAQSTLAQ